MFDAPVVDVLAAFYTELTGWPIRRSKPDRITLQTTAGPLFELQRAPEHIVPQWPGQEHPQQFHLDLDVDQLAEAVDRAIELGAGRLAEGPSWVTLADLAGHPFDLCQAREIVPMSRLWVSIGAPDPAFLADFYAALLGMELTRQGHEGTAIASGATTLFFQQVSAYRSPRSPDRVSPQQAHLDVVVDDLDRSEAVALEIGASRLQGGDALRIFADPAGHSFCLIS